MFQKILFTLLGIFLLHTPSFAAQINTYNLDKNTQILRILDKPNAIPVQILLGTDKKIVQQILPEGSCPSAFASFLIVTPKEKILIDTGYGNIGNGKTLDLLEKAGISRNSITRILLTHMHQDHMGGLLDNGKKIYPNAKLYIDEREFAFWTNGENRSKAPANQERCFDTAAKIAQVYGNTIELFRAPQILFGTIAAELTPGHTNGHTSFVLTHKGIQYIFLGDVLHCLAVQAPYPDVTVPWDTDQNLARQTRKQFLQKIANTDSLIFGAHFPDPGVVRFHTISNTKEQGYSTTPVFPK